MDNTPPSEDKQPPLMVVGIGASAGGYEAFRDLLLALPDKCGFAVVFVQHLDPGHDTMLPSLLSRATTLRVTQITDAVGIEPDTVYVAPPKASVAIMDGMLRLQPLETALERHRSIDAFFQSLAADRHQRAVGVLLSGTASDGVNGLKAIKAEGGVALVQEESTARFDSMPRAAIQAGVADVVLPPADLARELLRIRDHAPALPQSDAPSNDGDDELLRRILARVWSVSSVDFSSYKQTTLRRRITRRLVLSRSSSYADYLQLLERNATEAQALYQDLVIHVTSFFRDPEIFDVLKSELLQRLLEDKPQHAPLRVWVPGCSTGEEVYSLVITLLEYLGENVPSTPIQVFGTDISDSAIERARSGIYPEGIEADVSAERLRRFFQKRDAGYQIAKPVRDLCVFARQNVFKDPPFSNVDLISCRNVLIYFGPDLQRRVLPMFHYALNPTGYLILGSSESIGAFSDYFAPAHAKHKIFAKRTVAPGASVPMARMEKPFDQVQLLPPRDELQRTFDPQREADRFLLERYGPPSVLVNEEMNILQFRGRTGDFLEPAPGAASLNLLRMAREGLMVALHTTIHEASSRGLPTRKDGNVYQSPHGPARVDLHIIPIQGPGERRERFYLVLFENPARDASVSDGPVPAARPPAAPDDDERLALRQELAATKDYLQAVIESQESFNEELRSANEEILSANEELQSTNEELETAKEELQSANEELTTLNEELQTRNEALAKLNDDLNNLLNSINVAVVILDAELRVRRFTAVAGKLMNLIPTDIGRPFQHINPRIELPRIADVLREVVDKLATHEFDVRDAEGHWYNLRIRPYKMVENRIDGALLALMDIDSMKKGAARARQMQNYELAVTEVVTTPLIVLDGGLRVHRVNTAFARLFQTTREEVQGKSLDTLGGGALVHETLQRLLDSPPGTTRVEGMELEFPGQSRRRVNVSVHRLVDPEDDSASVLVGLDL